MDGTERPGFHGKLPSRGDFLTRGLPRSFVEPWDDWLQRGMEASRKSLGEEWLSIYLGSPIWRFALSAGVCGPGPVVGIFLPSVDKVGRYFPFTVALVLSRATEPLSLLGAGTWFEAIEARALAALENDTLDPVSLEADLGASGAPRTDGLAPVSTPDGGIMAVRIESVARATEGIGSLAAAVMSAAGTRNPTLWWTDGSDVCPPLLLASEGLVRDAAFGVFFLGRLG